MTGRGGVAAGDGEAGWRAKYPLGEAPEAPAGAGHAIEHGALDVHDLVAEPGEQQADLVAGERVDAGTPAFENALAAVRDEKLTARGPPAGRLSSSIRAYKRIGW